jgi:hypothetical protein
LTERGDFKFVGRTYLSLELSLAIVTRRNLLCLRKKASLDLDHRLLFEAYKEELKSLIDMATSIGSKSLDPISAAYSGLRSLSKNISSYYEAMLEVTSYYQASKGGRGKYIEKKIASLAPLCCCGVSLKTLPIWLAEPKIYRESKLLGEKTLKNEEKESLNKLSEKWSWIGGRKNPPIDLTNRIDSSIVFLELKNRVDSGGTAARRETWIEKYRDKILDTIVKKRPLYKSGKQYSMIQMLKTFGISMLSMYFGILFNLDGSTATLEKDRSDGFYSESTRVFEDVAQFLQNQSNVRIISKDTNGLKIVASVNGLKMEIASIYGEEVFEKLLRQRVRLNDLLVLQFDDMWLSQMIAIHERATLIAVGKNRITIFNDLRKMDSILMQKYREVMNSEGNAKMLDQTVKYLLEKYGTRFEGLGDVPQGFQSAETYLSDVIAVLAASEK